MIHSKDLEIWGGLECTINRVGDNYFDQLEYTGHYSRGTEDINLIASLGIKMLRYPVLWERHLPGTPANWAFTKLNLHRIRDLGIIPIVGLVHHGCGPRYVNFFDGSFESGVGTFAKEVAERFPWVEYYNPINEPLTTARFSGLYGHWHPHGKNDFTFYKILLSECKAVVMAMEQIRKVNPDAKLIQTEDLGKCYSTPMLTYQAEFENNRRWLSYDLLCGKVDKHHIMWHALIDAGLSEDEILYFKTHTCVPHIAGFNYYLTSERFLSEELSNFPAQYHGGNGRHRYADIDTFLSLTTGANGANGPGVILKEAWEHLHIPLAITECHLNASPKDQMEWFYYIWRSIQDLKEEGVDVRALTVWALFGSYGWNNLVTKPMGQYEPGIFDVSSNRPRSTPLVKLVQELSSRSHSFPKMTLLSA